MPPVSPLLRELPFNSSELTWQDFEELIKQIAQHPKGEGYKNVLRYGHSGQAQDGVDVFAYDEYAKCHYVFQCKHVREVKRGSLRSWVNDFLLGKFGKTAEKYYLCLATNISDTQLIREWGECQGLLLENKIEGVLWARSQLEDKLRELPSVVTQYFGASYAERFCQGVELNGSPKMDKQYRTKYCSDFSLGRFIALENENVHCSIMLPGDGSMNCSATLTFSRHDLSGVTTVLSSSTLLGWLRWRAYVEFCTERPYGVKTHNSDQYIFQTPSTLLLLNQAEVENLDWVFEKAWPEVLKALSTQESIWRTLRFKKIPHLSELTYALVDVELRLWRVIQEFATVHDVANGDSPWHIFDAASGPLKVYVPNATDTLDAGYHLIMYAYNTEGIVLPSDSCVQLGWSPQYLPDSDRQGFTPRKNWDAEYCHDWLMNNLLPQVLKWDYQRSLASRSKSWLDFLRKPKKMPVLQKVEDWATSRAMSDAREWSGAPIADVKTGLHSLRNVARRLQAHFNIDWNVPIPKSFLVASLQVTERLAPYANPLDEYYMRGKLDLPSDIPFVQAVRNLRESINSMPNWYTFDLSLRCVCAVLDDAIDVPLQELNFAASQLRIIWQRYQEDILCRQL